MGIKRDGVHKSTLNSAQSKSAQNKLGIITMTTIITITVSISTTTTTTITSVIISITSTTSIIVTSIIITLCVPGKWLNLLQPEKTTSSEGGWTLRQG